MDRMSIKSLIFNNLAMLVLSSVAYAQLPDEKPDDATPLFDSTVIREVHITMAPVDWKTLKANYMEDTYYPANFQWADQTIENVGIRSRGNGSRSGVKPALKVSFDKYEKQKFLGLTVLALINMVQDPPMLRDWISMQVFRKMGSPAPRSAFVKVFVNDEYYGLYLAVEAIEKPFLARNFDDNDGWLYDYEWASEYHWEYMGPDPVLYPQFQLQTNKTKPNFEAVADMLKKLQATSPETFIADMAPLVNIDNLLLHVAIEVYIAEMDGFVGDVGTNNFYMYQGSQDPRFLFIAWDKSATFSWTGYPIWRHMDENLLIGKALQVPELRLAFLQYLLIIRDTVGGEGGWLDQTADFAINLIRQTGLEDPNKPYSNGEFEYSLDVVKFFVKARHEDVLRQIDEAVGLTPSPGPVEP